MNQLGGNILILILLIGCSSQVVIKDPSIPDLLIEKSPHNVAIIYPENFNNFVHEEKVIGRKSWTIDFSIVHDFLPITFSSCTKLLKFSG